MVSSNARYCGCGARLARDNTGSMCSACARSARELDDHPPEVPPAFWTAEPIQEALESWHMGKVIAAYRNHAYHERPLSQEQVARWMGFTQAQLSRIENGEPVQDLTKLIEWAQRLGIPPRLLWFKLPAAPDNDASAAFESAARQPDLAALASGAATESLHFARTTTDTGLTTELIDQLHWEIECAAADYVHSPLHIVFRDLVATRDTVFELLSRRHRPRHARELYHLAATVCVMLAHGSQNAGSRRAAQAQLRTAWTCAEASESDALRAWILGTAALVEEWSGNYDRAVDFAQRGSVYLASNESMIRLAAIEARAAARLGDEARVTTALRRFRNARNAATRGDPVVEFGGLLSFPEVKQRYYLGSTHGLIGHHRHAERYAQQAIDTYVTGPPDERSYGDEALARLDIVNARIADGNLDGAGEALAPVLNLPPSLRIKQLNTPLKRVDALLSDPGVSQAKRASELRELLVAYHDESRHARRRLAAAP